MATIAALAWRYGINIKGAIMSNTVNDVDEVATLVKRLQRAGHGVRQLPDGGFLAHRWGMSVHLPDLAALQRFAHNVLGGKK